MITGAAEYLQNFWPYVRGCCVIFSSLCNSCNFQYLILGWPPVVLSPSIVFCSASPSTLHRYSMCTIQASPPTLTTKLLRNKWNISLEWSHLSCTEDWRRASSWPRWVDNTSLCGILPIWYVGGENKASNNAIMGSGNFCWWNIFVGAINKKI